MLYALLDIVVLLGVVGCCWVMLGVVGYCWMLLDMVLLGVVCFWVLLNFIGCCWVLLNVVGCLLGVIGCCWVLLGVVGCCWMLLGDVGVFGCCWMLVGDVGCCWMLLDVVAKDIKIWVCAAVLLTATGYLMGREPLGSVLVLNLQFVMLMLVKICSVGQGIVMGCNSSIMLLWLWWMPAVVVWWLCVTLNVFFQGWGNGCHGNDILPLFSFVNDVCNG